MRTLFTLIFASALPLAAFAAGCGDDSTGSGSGQGGDTSGSGAAGGSGGATGSGGAAACQPTEVACADDVILQMNLQADPAPGLITSAADGDGFESHIDATAGGAFATTPDSYTYGKFTDTGLEKVDIGDEDSLDSVDWDIAFRRYVLRINSGDSGPSCVEAARAPATEAFETLSALPDGLSFHVDDYFTDSCALIPDGSGLPGSPATALSGYWEYPGCVKMSGVVYVLQLADGRHVKLIVDDYYEPSIQEECQQTDAVPMGDTGSANFIVRWAFLP